MSFLVWLEQTGLSVWIREAQTLWAFPFILFLHTLGLGVAVEHGRREAFDLGRCGWGGGRGGVAAHPVEDALPHGQLGSALGVLRFRLRQLEAVITGILGHEQRARGWLGQAREADVPHLRTRVSLRTAGRSDARLSDILALTGRQSTPSSV